MIDWGGHDRKDIMSFQLIITNEKSLILDYYELHDKWKILYALMIRTL